MKFIIKIRRIVAAFWKKNHFNNPNICEVKEDLLKTRFEKILLKLN